MFISVQITGWIWNPIYFTVIIDINKWKAGDYDLHIINSFMDSDIEFDYSEKQFTSSTLSKTYYIKDLIDNLEEIENEIEERQNIQKFNKNRSEQIFLRLILNNYYSEESEEIKERIRQIIDSDCVNSLSIECKGLTSGNCIDQHRMKIFLELKDIKTVTYEITGYSYAIIVKNVANFTKRFTNL